MCHDKVYNAPKITPNTTLSSAIIAELLGQVNMKPSIDECHASSGETAVPNHDDDAKVLVFISSVSKMLTSNENSESNRP